MVRGKAWLLHAFSLANSYLVGIMGVILQERVLTGRIQLYGSTYFDQRLFGLCIALAPLNVYIMTYNKLFSDFILLFGITVT